MIIPFNIIQLSNVYVASWKYNFSLGIFNFLWHSILEKSFRCVFKINVRCISVNLYETDTVEGKISKEFRLV